MLDIILDFNCVEFHCVFVVKEVGPSVFIN